MPRRRLLGGAGLVGIAGLGSYLYTRAPGFWKQYVHEFGRPVLAAPASPRPDRWPNRGLFATWLGHATVLLKIDGYTILTDPLFSRRAGVDFGFFTLGIKRLVEPALTLHRLPRIDLILISHAHMDHLDLPSLRDLENPHTTVITARNTSDLIRMDRYKAVYELGWGESVQAGPILVKGTEVNHWGARIRTDTHRGYNGYVLESGRYRTLFAGDTANTTLFRKLHSSRPFDLAIMPIGAYNPWIHYHCTPEQAWRMGNEARAEFFLPIHHQTFALGREPIGEPLQRLLEAAGAEARRIAIESIGGEMQIG